MRERMTFSIRYWGFVPWMESAPRMVVLAMPGGVAAAGGGSLFDWSGGAPKWGPSRRRRWLAACAWLAEERRGLWGERKRRWCFRRSLAPPSTPPDSSLLLDLPARSPAPRPCPSSANSSALKSLPFPRRPHSDPVSSTPPSQVRPSFALAPLPANLFAASPNPNRHQARRRIL